MEQSDFWPLDNFKTFWSSAFCDMDFQILMMKKFLKVEKIPRTFFSIQMLWNKKEDPANRESSISDWKNRTNFAFVILTKAAAQACGKK